MQEDFSALLQEYSVSEDFCKFLLANEVLSISDYVLAAGNKHERVDEELIKASGIRDPSI